MVTTDERMGVLEARVETLMETLATQLGTMNERLGDLRAWLLALTGLSAAQLTALVAIALTLARR
jgi:hypothetical protein